jgi:hypothetical protein
VVLEGLAGYDKGMESLFVDIPRRHINDKEVKILSNPEVLFHERMYTKFGPDIKRIRPRDKMKKLVVKPELYDRKQVDALCFEAMEKIMELRRAVDLNSTKEFSMYPSVESLGKMELLYGEAISKADMDGEQAVRAKRAKAAKKNTTGADNSTLTNSLVSDDKNGSPSKNPPLVVQVVDGSVSQLGTARRHRESRMAETDCWNDAFVERLAMRDPSHPQHSYVMEQRELRRQAWRQGLQRRAQRDAEDAETLARVRRKKCVLHVCCALID